MELQELLLAEANDKLKERTSHQTLHFPPGQAGRKSMEEKVIKLFYRLFSSARLEDVLNLVHNALQWAPLQLAKVGLGTMRTSVV